MQVLFKENDNLVKIVGLKDISTGSYANSATCTFTLYDKDGNAVTGAENITMNYISGSNGEYQGTVESTVSLVSGQRYKLVITATQGSNAAKFELPIKAATRSTG